MTTRAEVPRRLPELAVGVSAGAGLRWCVGLMMGSVAALVIVNVIGCAVMGTLTTAGERSKIALGAGFCGGLTTLSGLALTVAQRLEDGRLTSALTIAVGIGVLSTMGYALGRTARRMMR